MSGIVQRTNPDRKRTTAGERWACAVCQTSYVDKGDAIACAENDHLTGQRERKQPVPAPEVPFDMVTPPCTLDVTKEVKA